MDEQNRQNLVWNADQGDGREATVECSGDSLWVSAGPGFETADIWMKMVGRTADLCITVTRTADGIEIVVNRGKVDPRWWKPGLEPKLNVSVLGEAVTVRAALGQQL